MDKTKSEEINLGKQQKLDTLTFRIDVLARLLILERFSCQHSLYSGQHDY